MTSRITVVGLGPAGRDQLTLAAHAALASGGRGYARTARHPAVAALAAEGVELVALDAEYETAATLDDAYTAIVARLLDASAAHGHVLYAVPGSPWVAEQTVQILLRRAAGAGVDVDVIDGLSFVEPVLAAVGVDALAGGLTILDGRRLEAPSPWTPLLVAQVDSRLVLGDVKLTLLDVLPAMHEVALVTGAGTPGVAVVRAPLAEIDHGDTDPGPLACLFVPASVSLRPFPVEARHHAAGRAFADLVALQERLRRPGGCPWDAKQTHHTLARYLLEEAYEALEAIDALPPEAPAGDPDRGVYADLEEELGDFLCQSVFHACLAEEAGAFDAADMVRGIVDKLVARHPHVFGEEIANSAEEVLANWEQRKVAEKGRTSVMDGIPQAQPALLRASKLQSRSGAAGLDWDGARPTDAAHAAIDTGGIGVALFALVALARRAGLDAESVLRSYLDNWEAAFRAAEAEGRVPSVPPWAVE